MAEGNDDDNPASIPVVPVKVGTLQAGAREPWIVVDTCTAGTAAHSSREDAGPLTAHPVFSVQVQKGPPCIARGAVAATYRDYPHLAAPH